MQQNYIGITEARLHHILGVSRKAYKIAKEMGYDERFCRKCYRQCYQVGGQSKCYILTLKQYYTSQRKYS